MATCDSNVLLEDGKCFGCLSDQQIQTIQTQLLYEIAGSTKTPEQLLEDGKEFSSLDDQQIRTVQIQLLCEISQV